MTRVAHLAGAELALWDAAARDSVHAPIVLVFWKDRLTSTRKLLVRKPFRPDFRALFGRKRPRFEGFLSDAE